MATIHFCFSSWKYFEQVSTECYYNKRGLNLIIIKLVITKSHMIEVNLIYASYTLYRYLKIWSSKICKCVSLY